MYGTVGHGSTAVQLYRYRTTSRSRVVHYKCTRESVVVLAVVLAVRQLYVPVVEYGTVLVGTTIAVL